MREPSLVPSGTINRGSGQSVPDNSGNPSHHATGSPTSFFNYLTDDQLGGVVGFSVGHEDCLDLDFDVTWSSDLTRVLEVVVSCPCCAESRSYFDEGG